MLLNRYQKKQEFIKIVNNLNKQVLIVRGARQVGKTFFISNVLQEIKSPQIHIDCFQPGSFMMGSSLMGSVMGEQNRLGRDFFGKTSVEFINNIHLYFKNRGQNIQNLPAIIFIDEADHYPPVIEAIQTLAEYSPTLKFIITGSNLENVPVKNAATGRKFFFDLYPITFYDYLRAAGREDLVSYCYEQSLKSLSHSDYFHGQLNQAFDIYRRLGGMPRLVDRYLDPKKDDSLPHIVINLVTTIEENIKSILDEKAKLYEYHDVLRTLARLSLITLKYTRLQVQNAGRSEAKRLVAKTVGARVAHKIRLMDAESDLSKYMLFDSGVANFLLNGSDLLLNIISPESMGILSETFVANELIARLITRDDLFYWKSENKAELEFLLRSPVMTGIDVKTKDGSNKSLASFALREKQAGCLVKISDSPLSFEPNYIARLATSSEQRNIPFLKMPHYLVPRLLEYLKELNQS